jgi:hypothetical protein
MPEAITRRMATIFPDAELDRLIVELGRHPLVEEPSPV